jgi:hypothetical protein
MLWGADRWGSMPNGAHQSHGRGRVCYRTGPTSALWRSALTFSSTDQPKTDHAPERTRDPAECAESLALARTRTHGDPAEKYRNAMHGPASVATREDVAARIAGHIASPNGARLDRGRGQLSGQSSRCRRCGNPRAGRGNTRTLATPSTSLATMCKTVVTRRQCQPFFDRSGTRSAAGVFSPTPPRRFRACCERISRCQRQPMTAACATTGQLHRPDGKCCSKARA